MNKRKIGLALSAILLAAFFAYGTASVINAGNVEVINAEFKAIPENDTKENYMVKEYQGDIGIYLKSEDKYILSDVLNSDVSLLPDADKKALKEGIYLSDKEKLIMLLEDYSD